ncbi:glycosyltransferase [Cylindrospermopsis raciborskii]|jgi:GT2 family glycosyltransferase|uniref:glycosyltransferase n=1 Tax=Cylindrospermopsis raciborskii TaxID=77022 RepID=UPI000E1F8A68|nr:glycosyltransferase [Cylindrospermopsis raciborskii]UJL33544.1 glycosyltransferase [Cylindrospermopsis raciborskii Cr2010]
MIYFITVNYYCANLIKKLIDSISNNANLDYQIIIVNNSSDDESIYSLNSPSTLIIDADKNLGFGSACNVGLEWVYTQDKEATIWIINPDAYFTDNTLERARTFLQSYPKLSIIGTIIYTPAGKIWFAGGIFTPATGAILEVNVLTNDAIDYVNCDWVSGCSLIINLRNFSECPLFDDAYFLYYEDFDFCMRYADQGHLIAITKQLSVIHQPSSVTNRNVFRKIRYSTYSYLLTIDKYTDKLIFYIRLFQQIIKAIMGLLIRPKAALGKICGILDYVSNHYQRKSLYRE